MTSTTETFRGSDGTVLALRRWRAPSRWATVVLVHGLGEHGGRYEHVGDRFAAAGLETIVADLRGFGRSGGPRAYVDRWDRFLDDLELEVREVRSTTPDRPTVLYGHSLGGLIALGYVLDGRTSPDALVLSGPAIAAAVPARKRILASVLGGVAPRLQVANGLDPAALCKDAAIADAYVHDPLNVHRSTTRLAVEAFRAQRLALERLDRLAIPTLVIHGEADSIVPVATSAVIGGRPGVERRVYPGVRHELHNDLERDVVLDDVIAWIRTTVGGLALAGAPLAPPIDPLGSSVPDAVR